MKITRRYLGIAAPAALALFFSLLSAALSAPPDHRRLPMIDMRPDLRVHLIIQHVGFFREDGTRCYRTGPVYNVTNKGHSRAKAFKNKVYMRKQGETVWRFMGFDTCSLKPGETCSRVWAARNVWCPDRPGKVGFRVVVDGDNEVSETNEHNNMAEQFYGLP